MLVEVQSTDGDTRSLKTSPSLSKKQAVLSNLIPHAGADLIKSLFLVFHSLCLRASVVNLLSKKDVYMDTTN